MDIPTDFTGAGANHGAMNRMTSYLFPGAGALMGPLGPGMRHPQHHMDPQELTPFAGGMMSPFGRALGGIPDLSGMFNNMGPAAATGHQFSSSSFVSISSGPDGRPHVYQASAVTREGPDGLRETRKTLQDSRTGTKKMAVGRHMNERGLVVEREQNVRTGQLNENHEFFNLDEDEVPQFDQEWRMRAQQGFGGRYAHSSSMPTITPQVAVPTGSSYVDELEEDQSGYQPAAIGYLPQHSHRAVTAEDLPASDEEEERQQQSCAVSRHNLPSASANSPSIASLKRQKRSGNGKKY